MVVLRNTGGSNGPGHKTSYSLVLVPRARQHATPTRAEAPLIQGRQYGWITPFGGY